MHVDRTAATDGKPIVAEDCLDAGVLDGKGHQHRFCSQGGRLTPMAGVKVGGRHQPLQQHLPQPGQALGPDQRQIGVGLPRLAAGLLAFRSHPFIRDAIELGVQRLSIPLHGQPLQAAVPASGVVPTLLAAGCHQLEGQKQGPFRFDAFKFGQFLRLVMQSADILHSGLVSVAEEAFVAIGPP